MCNTGCGSSCGSSCGSTCGSVDCIGTETRKVPEPDSKYNEEPARGSGGRTFGGEDEPRDEFTPRNDTRERDLLERERELLERERELRSRGNPADRSEWTPRSNSGRGILDDTNAPAPSFNGDTNRGGTSTFGGGSGIDRGGFGGGSNSTPDRGGFGGGSSFGTEPDPDLRPLGERENYRPPMEEPNEAAEPTTDGDRSTQKPVKDIPIDGADEAAPADGSTPGIEVPADDFLPADDTTQARSSHFDVLAMKRLAGSRTRRLSATQVSSSHDKRQAPRWISLPLPPGRSRL